MAWGAYIGGVDHTADLDMTAPVTITLALNSRARASFKTLPGYSPDRFDSVILYAQDGTTPLFGGFVLQRRRLGLVPGAVPASVECEAVGLDAYLDWAVLTLSWTTDPTLQTVLDDLIAALPASYGITLDATDYSGTTLAAFAWTNVRASDGLRELCDRCGLVYTMSPTGVLALAAPGGTPAPYSLTDAAPHCRELTWEDPVDPPVTTITLLYGTGTASRSATFLGSDRTDDPGGEYSYFTVPHATPSDINLPWPNVLTFAGSSIGGPVLWGADTGHTWALSWDYVNHRVQWDRTILGDVDDGWSVTVPYTQLFPATVTVGAGSPLTTPEVVRVEVRPDVFEEDQAREIAEGLLAQAGATAARVGEVITLESGWQPGQELTVNLTGRAMNATCAITGVAITLDYDTHWVYRLTAVELTDYDGGYLAAWRALLGGSTSGAGSAVTTGPSGDVFVTGTPPLYYMGGSRTGAVQVPA
jgi:hypothetical protein